MIFEMIEDIRQIAAEAGEAILETYDGPAEIELKEDDSPLTQADRAAHDCIVAALANLTPNIPVLSEESEGIPTEERLGWNRFWLVDPLDGTKEFIKKTGQFTVNINNSDHPGVAGISDFVTNDELYMGLEYSGDNDVFMTGDSAEGTHDWGGKPTHMPAGTFPLGWTRTYGNGKVFVTLLGHDGRSFETPQFQQIVLNGVDWATS